ncbi:PerC family transcriptional regulator [Citrobacter freundii]|uniref:PerC family transcriptional regulator n=1 Tax=Citrobacter freundii TaxID=546 RepID=UPI00155E79FF|nr:PerC family transcriptional regulator [Citrobacter freundii]WBM50151.1 PerC family transcriptional regulator [Citrobacter freundii]WHW82909.1 PerC family transcriptional regulator [Citrobacter freundii]WHW92425.1 PerC family transcriptional regulator [Citrobacter freundii]
MADELRVRDVLAEELEHKGLYRRAASRWLVVLEQCADEKDREWVALRRIHCVDCARLPPVQVDNFGEVRRAASQTQRRMGLEQLNGNTFRLK